MSEPGLNDQLQELYSATGELETQVTMLKERVQDQEQTLRWLVPTTVSFALLTALIASKPLWP